jgi:hypothetical protein
MKGKRNFRAVAGTLILAFMFCLFNGTNLIAQGTAISVGGGLALLYHEPEEADLEKDGFPMDFYANLDFSKMLKFRAGINLASAKISYSGGEEKVSTTSLYGAYRYEMEIISNLNLFAMGGLAYVMATAFDESDSSFGYLVGGGGLYKLSALGLDQVSVGGQFIYISSELESEGVKIATGSNQLQLTGQYHF